MRFLLNQLKALRFSGSYCFYRIIRPIIKITKSMSKKQSGGNRPLQMTFDDHLKSLIFFHLQEHTSAQHLLQSMEQDEFARKHIAPEKGIKKSSFSEIMNSRNLEQFLYVFEQLQSEAADILPKAHLELGNLVGIDGSLIDATLSMNWADYRKNTKKAKVHIGFDLNRGIPRKVFLTEGKGSERPFVSQILSANETSVNDRGYQCHKRFDKWQQENKFFICRIKADTNKTILKNNVIIPNSIVFFDSMVLLGTPNINQTENPLRLVGYKVGSTQYWIATNRCELTAEQIAAAYKLRWEIENFFAWWKRHLKVYHLIARSKHGLMVQILAGLITYLLLAIYCHQQFNEKVSIYRVRQMRIQIQNELRNTALYMTENYHTFKELIIKALYAKT